MPHPVIGISASSEQARFGPWDVPTILQPRSYAEAIQRAGGLALLLPPDDAAAERPDGLLDRLDALLVAGGADMHPESYAAEPHPETRYADKRRDRFEIGLSRRALERDVPLLGVCRGMQVLNVALGGTLEQHLPDRVGDERHRPVPGEFTDHEVRLEPGSLAARAAGAERVTVKSHHHQGIRELAPELEASGFSDDGEVEAVELPDGRFALGVLWHPEEDPADRVVAALVTAADSGEP
jgi:putative glutamine amidotransferase